MKTVNLGDVCDVLGGKRIPKGEKLSDVATNHPYIRVADFDGAGGVSTSNLKYIPDKIWSQISRYTINKDDVFLSIAGTIGVTGFIPDELDGANLTENACKLVAKSDLDKRYLYYFTLSTSFRSQTLAGIKQTAQPKLALTRIKDIRIPLPSLEEQRRIVARLDAAFEKISAAEVLTRQNLDNVSALQKSILHKYLSASDSTHRLGDIITLQRGYDLPKRQRTHGKYPLASSSGIIDTHNEFKSTGPGVFTGRSGSIGGVFYVEDDFWPLNTTLYVKDFHGNNPRYCYWLLKNIDLTQFSGGTGVPTLNRNIVHEHMVSVVEVGRQADIVNKIDDATEKIRKLETQYTEKLAKLAELRQSLLAEAFMTTSAV